MTPRPDPIEEARNLKHLMDAEGWDGRVVARKVGMSPATVSRRLQLLRLLPGLQERVRRGEIGPRVAAFLAGLTPSRQDYYTRRKRAPTLREVMEDVSGAETDPCPRCGGTGRVLKDSAKEGR